MTARGQAVLLLALGVSLRAWLAGRWGITGEEAVLWADGASGHGTLLARGLGQLPPNLLALRLPGLLLQAVGALALLPHVSHPRRFAALVVVTPAFFGLGGFATPFAWASGVFALALAASLQGGTGHLLAGVWIGMGMGMGPEVASTLLAWPVLALVAMEGEERRRPWGWLGAAVAMAAAVLAGVQGPGWSGEVSPLRVVVHQALWSAPLLGVAWGVALGTRGTGRSERFARWASLPLLVGASVGAAGGLVMPAGAVSVLWWGALVAVARAEGPAGRLGEVSAWLGIPLGLAVVGHVERPLLPLQQDPAVALHAAEPLADDAVRWAMPVGVPRHAPRAVQATLVLTARPQDAARIRFLTGIPAEVWDGCRSDGRGVRAVLPAAAVFVRPAADGGPCTDDAWEVVRRQRSDAFGPAGRPVGSWEWFELTPRG